MRLPYYLLMVSIELSWNLYERKCGVLKMNSHFFFPDNIRALVLLPKLLPPMLGKGTPKRHLDHLKLYKDEIDRIPSSAIFQQVMVSFTS